MRGGRALAVKKEKSAVDNATKSADLFAFFASFEARNALYYAYEYFTFFRRARRCVADAAVWVVLFMRAYYQAGKARQAVPKTTANAEKNRTNRKNSSPAKGGRACVLYRGKETP